MVGAVNWSEIFQKVTARGADVEAVRALIEGYGTSIEPVTQADAEMAAGMWAPGSPLSLGDRLCLALAQRLEVQVLTADRAWGESEGIVQIRE